ncbi:recombination protein RecR [Candidatus Beckwithbacteria bacterium RIFCSPHIGHO2_12_FULL_47_17]|uniref:Recombination protein RecR n=1 Tax=Candidatus Beckwithbacteria bacterium RIFCSPHIGHO2_12_FULL_47_17 TaxID=1797460 RepID=A0A1F5DPD3_9BACT|nr:MAG: recombination protein RecR [Candidatus Beckwithbacteria bacterium RIFCSPHIGHO2_12_FULL_47_17]
MRIARAVSRLISSFEKLPGIGPKTAQRLTFYLLHNPQSELESFAQALARLKKDTQECSLCFNVSETDPCPICVDRAREQSQVCVVETPLDVLVIEKGGFYHGLYHVLGGAISPLNNLGPDELHLYDLLPRLKNGKIGEIILATNPSMEGEATAMFIAKLVKDKFKKINLTRLGRGLPIGADIEYADEQTLSRAFEGRREF